ncbi:hypothetical protein H0H81_009707 [Sphagnurus paluster]|uniref:ASX DEUBAD domain-containing protein n=1 Tax=Sphagnurus paluster TaxID=117069 RepID=A0A9P7GR66_9AGAR|nr:hypothetical protein H0H81_009707 [Sphagnurus paluster]
MDRPRRSTRQPAKFLDATRSSPPPASSPIRPKRKSQDVDPVNQLHMLLTSPKSILTSIDISDLINAASWDMLSPDSKAMLKALLPPTAFLGFREMIGQDHPSAAEAESDVMAIDAMGEVDTSLFTDPHFLAAAHTLQDHIYSDWMSDAHALKVKRFEEGVRDGTMAAAWKDEVWERNNAAPVAAVMSTSESGARAGDAAEVKLVTLAKSGVLRVGDLIVLKRNFQNLNLVVEKDAIIQSIHPKTHALTVLFEPGPAVHLPQHLLSPYPGEASAPTQVASITSPTQLETALLDNDGRVERARRPNGNAWKCMTVWRWRGEPPDTPGDGDGRWGRESHATLFYLRGTYFHER